LNAGKVADVFGVTHLRNLASSSVEGNVLEVAMGTGIQSSFYNEKNIKSYVGIDESAKMLEEGKKRISSTLPNIPTKLLQMDASKLSFDNESFDTVIDTFSLCVIENPLIALKEMARVVKPDGKIILVENMKSSNTIVGMIQDLTEPLITENSKGCRWNIDIDRLTNSVGLQIMSKTSTALGTLGLNIYTKAMTN
jgi:ubiquinone/menaquinone biosynthesis C-methylase UbiE